MLPRGYRDLNQPELSRGERSDAYREAFARFCKQVEALGDEGAAILNDEDRALTARRLARSAEHFAGTLGARTGNEALAALATELLMRRDSKRRENKLREERERMFRAALKLGGIAPSLLKDASRALVRKPRQ